jgi:hypothetical protein
LIAFVGISLKKVEQKEAADQSTAAGTVTHCTLNTGSVTAVLVSVPVSGPGIKYCTYSKFVPVSGTGTGKFQWPVSVLFGRQVS